MSPLWKFFGMKEANAAYQSAESVIDPLLIAAGVTDLKIKGESVPLEKAFLADKISAFAALCKPGADQQKIADLIVTNDTLAKAARESADKCTVAEATVQALQRDKTDLEGRLATATRSIEASVQAKGQADVEFKAATDTIARLQTEIDQTNRIVSRMCVDAGCLDLKDVPANASVEQKMISAVQIPLADKLKSYQGAVNSAITRFGVDTTKVPKSGGNETAANLTEAGVITQRAAIKDPVEAARFFKANKKTLVEVAFSRRN